MHTNTADRSDFPMDDDLTRGPRFETEKLLAQEHIPLKKPRSFNRAHCFSWAAQSLFFLVSLIILHQALLIRRTSPAKCAQKHSLFCKQQGGITRYERPLTCQIPQLLLSRSLTMSTKFGVLMAPSVMVLRIKVHQA